MTAAGFRRIALGLVGAIESEHMGHPDFRANGKIFATIKPDNKSGMVKLTPEQQERFVRDAPTSFAPENGAWGRAGCTKVLFARVDEDMLGDAMTLAWQNTAAKPKTKKMKS
jgi:YjbR